ncbi:deaminase [Clostridioides difficile]|uniref:deaminase n=1 Tax=Clostridioides difficile TaxID=1496 RepID=UPI003A8BF15F
MDIVLEPFTLNKMPFIIVQRSISVKNCSIYVTHFPCLNCTKAIIQAGIKHIYYRTGYRIDEYAIKLLQSSNVLYTKL